MVTAAAFVPTFADSIDADLFANGAFTATDTGYTVTVALKDWMAKYDMRALLDEMSSSSMGSIDEEALEKAMEGLVVTYTFDKDCHMTNIKMDDLNYKSTVQYSGIAFDMTVTMNLNVDFTNIGGVDESKTKAPESVVAAAG